MLNVIGLIIGESIFGSGPAPVPTFPCTIVNGQTYVVSVDTLTNCDPLTINNGGTLTINPGKILAQRSTIPTPPTPPPPPPPIDPDAQAYMDDIIAAGGTLSATEEGAINVLFQNLKSAGIYSDLTAMYPVVGSTEPSFAINAIGVTAYNLIFNGGFTFSSSGFTATTSSSYAATNYVPFTEHPSGAMSMGAFANTNVSLVDNYTMGAFSSSSRFLAWDLGSGQVTGEYLANSITSQALVPGNPFGFIQLSSDGTTKYVVANKNGIQYAASAAKDGTTLPSVQIFISNINVLGSPYKLQAGRICFAYMANYLNPAKITLFGSIVNTFQSTLGRNTY
jgi:hypothetical protein